jgi:hypothetical protein
MCSFVGLLERLTKVSTDIVIISKESCKVGVYKYKKP